MLPPQAGHFERNPKEILEYRNQDWIMDFKQIEAFINVMQYGSFSKAADATFLTQPTISTHIKSLEDELGVTLIRRKGRNSEPTKEGLEFYKYAMDMVHTRELALEKIGNNADKDDTVINILTSSVPGTYLLPSIIEAYQQEKPGARFYIQQSDSAQVWNDITHQNGEIGFVGNLKKVSGIESCLICRDQSVVITPKNEKFLQMKAISDRISLKQLADQVFIGREEGSATRMVVENEMKAISSRSRKAGIIVNDLETIKRMVAHGCGFSIISGISAEADKDQGDYLVFRFEEDHPELDRRFYMIFNKEIHMSPAAGKFKNFIARNFALQGN